MRRRPDTNIQLKWTHWLECFEVHCPVIFNVTLSTISSRTPQPLFHPGFLLSTDKCNARSVQSSIPTGKFISRRVPLPGHRRRRPVIARAHTCTGSECWCPAAAAQSRQHELIAERFIEIRTGVDGPGPRALDTPQAGWEKAAGGLDLAAWHFLACTPLPPGR